MVAGGAVSQPSLSLCILVERIPLAFRSSSEYRKELEDPVVGLITEENLALAFCAVEANACEVLFLRMIGIQSIRSGHINIAVPSGFEMCGFEVSDGWWGASPNSVPKGRVKKIGRNSDQSQTVT